MMINTVTGAKINVDTFNESLNQILKNQFNIDTVIDDLISCIKENNGLIIHLKNDRLDNLNDIITSVYDLINHYQITDNFIIVNHDKVTIYSSKDININDNNHHQVFDTYNSNNEGEIIDNEDKLNYKSSNFSFSFIIFIVGTISLIFIGITYFFTRPCVVGECDLIPVTNQSISQLLKNNLNSDLSEEKIKSLIKEIALNIQQLKRIPTWSKYHSESLILINESKNKIKDLDKFIQSSKLENTALNLTQQLPLSADEWERIENYWQDAIAFMESVETEELQLLKEEKITQYQQQLIIVTNGKNQELEAVNKLTESQKIAQEITEKFSQINTLDNLKLVEQKWKEIILTIESITPQTTPYEEKEMLINDYLKELSKVQMKLSQEEKVLNQKELIMAKIKEAENEAKNNQWSKTVTLWNEAIKMMENIPSDSFLTEEIQTLKEDSRGKLDLAKGKLKEAIKKEEIKTELKKICTEKEKICSYSVDNNQVKVFLNNEYLKRIKSLSTLSKLTNDKQQKEQIKQQLINHIKQVEKNYQNISSKYKLKVEVYNPERELIMIYNPETPIQNSP